jgi:26S proteasome regulatory subunit N5
MSRREKLEFILYQMKIMIKREDYIRLFIISKKINEAHLNDDELIDLKVRYYAYMAIYYNHESRYNETSKCYKTIWETLSGTNVDDLPKETDFGFSIAYKDVLANYVGFLVLEPYTKKQQEELEKLQNSEEIEAIQHVYTFVSAFLNREIVSSDLKDYHLERYPLFNAGYLNFEKHKEALHNMLIQHDIRVMSEYYERLTMPRMAQLINVPSHEA